MVGCSVRLNWRDVITMSIFGRSTNRYQSGFSGFSLLFFSSHDSLSRPVSHYDYGSMLFILAAAADVLCCVVKTPFSFHFKDNKTQQKRQMLIGEGTKFSVVCIGAHARPSHNSRAF